MPGNPPTSGADDWTARLRSGDRSAFDALFRTHYPALCAFARRYVDDPSGAEELVQDVFLALWQRRTDLALRGNVKTYLYSAVRNAALDSLKHEAAARRLGGRAALALEPRGWPADSEARYRELAEAVEAATSALPERARLVFTLSREGGLSYAEIADTLGVSVKAVEAAMTRALRTLREKLAHFLD